MKVLRCLLVVIVLLLNVEAEAKTASEVFDIASKSTVVVVAYDDSNQVSSLGSGVVLPGGQVATNCHVIKTASNIAVYYQGKKYSASVKFTDWERDICALIVKGLKTPPVIIGKTRGLKVGSQVYAIGSPEGLELTLSEGIVSNLRQVSGGQYIQTTAPISPGSSGGGLFDEDGRLVGLICFFIEKGQNLNFALPVEWITELPKRDNPVPPISRAEIESITNEITDEEIVEYLREELRKNPEDAETWYELGSLYSKTGQITKAIESYESALRINPQYAQACVSLAILYSNANRIRYLDDAVYLPSKN